MNILKDKIVKIRKNHNCSSCGVECTKGEEYRCVTIKREKMENHYFCDVCVAILGDKNIEELLEDKKAIDGVLVNRGEDDRVYREDWKYFVELDTKGFIVRENRGEEKKIVTVDDFERALEIMKTLD